MLVLRAPLTSLHEFWKVFQLNRCILAEFLVARQGEAYSFLDD